MTILFNRFARMTRRTLSVLLIYCFFVQRMIRLGKNELTTYYGVCVRPKSTYSLLL